MTETITSERIRQVLPRVDLTGVSVQDDQIAKAVYESVVPEEEG